jgi:hypothetical protein
MSIAKSQIVEEEIKPIMDHDRVREYAFTGASCLDYRPDRIFRIAGERWRRLRRGQTDPLLDANLPKVVEPQSVSDSQCRFAERITALIGLCRL